MTGTLVLESFALAGVLSLVLGRLCMALALRLRWVDRPGHRKIHRKPVPYLGGLALFLALGLSVALLSLLPQWTTLTGDLGALKACLWPACAAAGLGLWDDLFDLRPRYKFFGQALIALVFCLTAYRFTALHIPGFASWSLDTSLSVLLTGYFMVAVANGYNMMDGSDALCLGASSVTLLCLAVITGAAGQPYLCLLALAAVGGCLGLLVWNRPPAKMYLGDAGSQGLGFLVACLILAAGKGQPGDFRVPLVHPGEPAPHYRIVVACLVLGWPALELLLTVFRRLLQGRGLGSADQEHLHHRLARLGLGPWAIAAVAMLVNLLCGGMVLAFLDGRKGLAVLLTLPLAVLFSMGMQRLGYMRLFQRDWLEDRRPHFAVIGHFAAMQAAKLRLARDSAEVLGLVEQACKEFGVHACRLSLADAEGKRWTWAWAHADPFPLHGSSRSRDRIRLSNTPAQASWLMDASGDEKEPELGMNLRVIMSEFMRRVLERLGELFQAQAQAAPGTAPQAEQGKRTLKSHAGGTASIKSLRQRL